MNNIMENVKMPQMPQMPDLSKSVANVAQSVKDGLNDFASRANVTASEPFLNTNSIIAKFAFVILVVIGFMVLLNLGTKLLIFLTQPSRNPYIVKGMVSGNANLVIPQDPKFQNSITLRSNNQKTGLEFTWSVWLYIDQFVDNKRKFNHIFHKGNNQYNDSDATMSGIATVNNGPGVYLTKNDNTGSLSLRIYMDNSVGNAFDQNGNDTYLDVTNIPIKKWFHLAVRMQNTIMDAYVNGSIAGRVNFVNVPKQNYDDIYVGCNGGFSGNLSNLVYYDRALSVFDINNIILKNPTLTQYNNAGSGGANGFYSYLSHIWYSNKL